jgi:allantoicase
LEILPESQSQEWWDNLKKAYQTKNYLPQLSISAISKSTLPPQPDEYATYRQANLKFGVGSILFSRSYFGEIIQEVFTHTKFTINLPF